jgi:outer membrane lipoprotein-sorting protein
MEDRGGVRTGIVVLAALALVTAGAAAAVGFAATDGVRTGEEILADVGETYNSTESISADATVTVRTDDYTRSYDVAVAAGDDDQFRINVTNDGRSVVAGLDGTAVWVADPKTGTSLAADAPDEDTLTLTLRAGTERLQGLSVVDLLERQGIDPDTTVEEFLSEVDRDRLPPEVRERLDELPDDATLAELAEGENLGGLADDPVVANLTDGEGLPDASALSAAFEESWLAGAIEDGTVEAGELPEELDDTAFGEWLADREDASISLEGAPDGALSNVSDRLADLKAGERPDWATGEFDLSETNLTVERVGTTTVDGREANELAITHPDHEGETRLWTAADTDEVLQVRTTSPNGTVTVDVRETRFDVSAADSTFEPPGAVTLATATLASTTDPAALGTGAPYEVARPGDGWTFQRGLTAVLDTSGVPAEDLPNETVAVAAAYTDAGDGNRSIVVAQTETTVDVADLADAGTETETETIAGREVAIVETERGAVAAWVDDGTTVVVAGDVDAGTIRTVVAGVIG